MRFGVVTFPGSTCDQDALYVLSEVLGQDVRRLRHADRDLHGADCVVLPGGFSYGDHLRCGALARFCPVMEEVIPFAARGGFVIGICNGFQILTEAGLLPGALRRNSGLSFVCEDAVLDVVRRDTPWTCLCPPRIVAPIAHGEGCWCADEAALARVEGEGRVVFRYAGANPNGSLHGIAGIVNAGGNVLGMMPHPERNAEPALGDASGAFVFRSIAESIRLLGAAS